MDQSSKDLLEFNITVLQQNEEKLLKDLYDLKESVGAVTVIRLLEIQANMRLLNINSAEDEKDLYYRRGAQDGLRSFINKAKSSLNNERQHRVNKKNKEDKRSKGVKKIERRSPAGAANY